MLTNCPKKSVPSQIFSLLYIGPWNSNLVKSQGKEDRFHYLCQGMPFVSLEKGKKTRATLPHHIKLSQTEDFGPHTGLNVSSLLILHKKFDFSTNSFRKKLASSKIWDDRPFPQYGSK